MRTMVLDVTVPKVVLTRFLGRFWKGAYFAPTSPLRLVDLPEARLPAPDWVRVRNRLCGICGSDLHQIFVDAGLDVAPVALPSHQRIYLGHEMVGEVVEAGKAVADLKVGDRVVRWGRGDDCLARGRAELCPACGRGHRVLCQCASEPREYEPVGGGFGDTFVTPASTLLCVPTNLTDDLAIFTEPAAVAIHAAWRCRAGTGEQVLIVGCGTIGFLLIQAVRALQPRCKITAVAQFSWQAEMARACGADHAFLAEDDGFAEVVRLTGAKLYEGRAGNRMLLGGFDIVFDVVGMEVTLNSALRWTRAGGTVVLVGVNLHRMNLDVTPVWYQEVDLIGAVGHDVVTWEGETLSTLPYASAYAASKAAVVALTRSLSQEVAEFGITVNAVLPGDVDTALKQWALQLEALVTGQAHDAVMAAAVAKVPLKRFAVPDDVANLVGFLASDEASFITGQAYNLTGGRELT